MNRFLKSGSFFLFLLILIGSIYAYQKPTPPPTETVPPAIAKQKKEAEALVNEGAWNEAILACKNIQEACLKLGLKQSAIDIYEELLSVVVLRDDIEQDAKIRALLDYRAKESNPLFTPIYYGAMAHFYSIAGEMDSVQYYYNQATKLYQNQNRPKLEANLNIIIALELFYLDDFLTAKTFLNRAEKILTSQLLPYNIDLPIIYNVQTLIFHGLGEFDKALKANLKSIELLEKDPDVAPSDLAYEYSNLAALYSTSSDYNNALVYYKKALELSPDDVTIQFNIASVHTHMGNNTQAKEGYLKSLSLLQQTKESNTEALGNYIDIYTNLSVCYRSEYLDSALYYIQEAEKINKTFPYRIAMTYNALGDIFSQQKDYVKAKFYYTLSAEKAKEAYGAKNVPLATAYQNLAITAKEENKLEEALAFCQKGLEALSIDFSDEKGKSNPKLENILYPKNLLTILTHKIIIINQLYDTASADIESSDVFASAKLATECLEQMNRGMKNMESKRHLLNTQAITLFERAIQLALDISEKTKDKTYLNEAFMLCERSKSMLMTDAMQESNAADLGGIPDSLLEQSNTLQELIAYAEKKRFDAHLANNLEAAKIQDNLIFGYKHELDILKHTFEKQYPKYYDIKYKSNVASIQDVQKTLDESTTFIEYFEGKETIYAFSINKTDAHTEIISKEKDYQTKIYEFQGVLTDMQRFFDKPAIVYNQFVKESHNFYNTLLKNSIIGQPKRLIIVPDGQLGYLPFDALLCKPVKNLDQKSKEADFTKLPYLINDYTISYNYSGSLLIAQQSQKNQIVNGDILALAPSYASANTPEWRGEREATLRKGLIELPGAAEEVSKLKTLFAGKFFIGAEANELLFKKEAPQHGVLHLAMHGLVDKTNPEFSGLAMTEDNNKKEDNFLYAYEIKQMSLKAGLVVLSACETGIGKYQRGEGVVSIGRGFMYAGAPALLMTLWSLNDQSGALIIESFYKNLSSGMQKDVAIREAKLGYLTQCSPTAAHPFLWAAFIQVGDYSAITVNTKSSWLLYMGGGLLALAAVALLGFRISKNNAA